MRGTLLAIILTAQACVTGATVDRTTKKLDATLRSNHDGFRTCAPQDLALAEAAITFSRHESEVGNTLAADHHLKNAVRLVSVVQSKSTGDSCEGDRDGDGIVDTVDRCPDIPEDFDGENDSDGCPDFDRDGDGVPDDRDKCPNDKEDKDGFQDGDGCPEFDNDRDGLIDTSDQCRNEPEDFDGFQDLDGCPDPDNDNDDVPDEKDKCPTQPGPVEANGCPDGGRGGRAAHEICVCQDWPAGTNQNA